MTSPLENPARKPKRCAPMSVSTPPAPVKARSPMPAATGAKAAAPTVGREQAERGEDGRRGADRTVIGTAQKPVRKVAERSRDDDREPAEAAAEIARDREAEEAAEGQIAEEMRGIGVQRQCRDRPPPLAGGQAGAVHAAGREPVEPEAHLGRNERHAEDDDGVGDDAGPGLSDRGQGRPRARSPARLGRVRLELALCSLNRIGCDAKRPGTAVPVHERGDRLRLEHERKLGAALALRREHDVDGLFGLHCGSGCVPLMSR